jgi:hypothetical protein
MSWRATDARRSPAQLRSRSSRSKIPRHVEALVAHKRAPVMRIVGPDGKLYAYAITTCLVFEAAMID